MKKLLFLLILGFRVNLQTDLVDSVKDIPIFKSGLAKRKKTFFSKKVGILLCSESLLLYDLSKKSVEETLILNDIKSVEALDNQSLKISATKSGVRPIILKVVLLCALILLGYKRCSTLG